MHTLTAVVSLGFDSFLACAALGTIAFSWRERLWLAAAFGACDAWASALATASPLGLVTMCAFFGVAAIYLGAIPSRRWLYALPVLFSIDNLLTRVPSSPAAVLGLSSAAMALAGLCVAALSHRALPKSILPFKRRSLIKLAGGLR